MCIVTNCLSFICVDCWTNVALPSLLGVMKQAIALIIPLGIRTDYHTYLWAVSKLVQFNQWQWKRLLQCLWLFDSDLFGQFSFLPGAVGPFWQFVWLSVSLCGCIFGLFASHVWVLCLCVLKLYVCLGVFCWLRWGRVYRAGPSRAQISDLHIPEPPLIASVCWPLQKNPSCISLGSISSLSSLPRSSALILFVSRSF